VLLDPGSIYRIGQRPVPDSWTVRYAAPEVLGGRPVGEQADLFAIAALAYHLSTGFPPFPGRSVMEVTRAIQRGAIPPGCRVRGIDTRFEGWILRSLEPDPGRRHVSAVDMLEELEAT
jgi:serine/threonine-protein kinase